MVTTTPVLRGLDGVRPTLVERSDEDFIAGLLADLSLPGGKEKVTGTAMQPGIGQPLALYQPVHRVFHLVVMELCCSQFGEPRLDPRRIESAGLVVRRVHHRRQTELVEKIGAGELLGKSAADKAEVPFALLKQEAWLAPAIEMEGWMQSGTTFAGWHSLLSQEAENQDPEPGRRVRKSSARPSLDLLLYPAPAELLGERVSPLFIAPPEVTRATGRTLLYAVVPVVSPEISDLPVRMEPFRETELKDFLHPYLQAGSGLPVPRANDTLTHENADPRGEDLRDQSLLDDLSDFIGFLRQVAVELDAFGDSAESRRLYALLNELQVPFPRLETFINELGFSEIRWVTDYRPAGDFLADATAVLLARRETNARGQPLRLLMPARWANVSVEQAAALLAATQTVLEKQVQILAPRQGRFDEPGNEYVLRAFVRVRQEENCPPKIVWSEYSPHYTIRPWFAPSPAPPPLIPLPDIDPNFLRSVKPNVSFVIPPGLSSILSNRPDAFLSGSAGPGARMALDMICGFNIPIITICAFIVLNIFLTLFDIIFHWMMFIKICMPFPRRSAG